MNAKTAEYLGNKLGAYEGFESKGDLFAWGKFLHIHVKIHLESPLKRVMHLFIEGKVHKVLFQYERLPILCFYCGRIGHGKRDCELKLDAATYETGDSQYGGWLRAKPEKSFSGQQHSRPAATVSDNENCVPQGTDKRNRSTASASPDYLEFSKFDHAQSATLDNDLERHQDLIKGKSSASISNNLDLLQPKSKSTAALWTTNKPSSFSTHPTDDSFRLPVAPHNKPRPSAPLDNNIPIQTNTRNKAPKASFTSIVQPENQIIQDKFFAFLTTSSQLPNLTLIQSRSNQLQTIVPIISPIISDPIPSSSEPPIHTTSNNPTSTLTHTNYLKT